MPQVRDPKTGRYTSGGGSSVGGAASTNPRIQKAKAVGGGATQENAWRQTQPRYQEKTAGGVYFYDRPGAFGEVIERKYYDKMPKYAQESVVALSSTDVSVSAWFKVDGGIAYLNTEKSDFLGTLKYHRSALRKAEGYKGTYDKDTVEYWEY